MISQVFLNLVSFKSLNIILFIPFFIVQGIAHPLHCPPLKKGIFLGMRVNV